MMRNGWISAGEEVGAFIMHCLQVEVYLMTGVLMGMLREMRKTFEK